MRVRAGDSGCRKKATRKVGHNVRGSNTKHVISVLHKFKRKNDANAKGPRSTKENRGKVPQTI